MLNWQHLHTSNECHWSVHGAPGQIVKFVMWAYNLTSATLLFGEISPYTNQSSTMTWLSLFRAVYSITNSPWLTVSGDLTTNQESFDIHMEVLPETSKCIRSVLM